MESKTENSFGKRKITKMIIFLIAGIFLILIATFAKDNYVFKLLVLSWLFIILLVLMAIADKL